MALPSTLTLIDISKATAQDESLCALKNALSNRANWNDLKLKPFKQIKNKIAIDHDHQVLLWGSRIIIPISLQKQVIKIAHQGHQGIAKTKARLREAVWFPNLDKHVRSELEHCLACQATSQPNRPEPINVTRIPDSPWDKVKIDFYGPLPSGQYILVVIGCYSRFPEIEILTAISAQKVIPKLDCIFAQH